MGIYLKFQCRFCQYQVESFPVGQGKDKTRALKLFCCDSCKSICSTWVTENESPRCQFCYETEIKLLSQEAGLVDCPKCGEPANIVVADGSWE